jgi:4-hydroxybenzoate polyprenyltransferase
MPRFARMSNHKAQSMLSPRFWQAYWITMRPYLLFVSGAAGAVGLAVGDNLRTLPSLLEFGCFFLSYGLGQALTDCFQTDTDAISSPYRPLVQGKVTRKQVGIISVVGLLLVACTLATIKPVLLLFGLLGVAGLLTYTPFKRTWWGGPPWNSWIVALLMLMGWQAATTSPLWPLSTAFAYMPRGFVWGLLAIFFGYANFVVMGYFKDISADRVTGYLTFPVVFGWHANAIYSDGLAICAAACTAVAVILSLQLVAVVALVMGVAINVAAQIGIHRTRDEQAAHGPIANVVRVFVLYAAALALAHQPQWIWMAIVFYMLFEITLRTRAEATQV